MLVIETTKTVIDKIAMISDDFASLQRENA